MKKEIQDTLRIRIAANILYRINRGFQLERINSDIYDFTALSPVDGLRFAIKVGSSTFTESVAFSEYVDLLSSRSFEEDDEQIPIVLMCVNESTEEARMGFVVGWKFFKPVIYKNVALQTVSGQNWTAFVDNVKAMDSVIRLLSEDTISVVKRIRIDETGQDGRHHGAEIIYLRKFTNDYKMQQKEVSDEKERFDRILHGIPENEYPSDMLDKDLLEEVRKKYPSANTRSGLLLFSSELSDLKQEIELFDSCKTVSFMIEPDLQTVIKLVGGYIVCPKFDFKLYVPSPFDREYFRDIHLSKIVPQDSWKDTFEYYSQIKNTITPNP